MPNKTIGRIIFKDGHTEDIVDYYEVVEDEWIEVWTKDANKYVYQKRFKYDDELGHSVPYDYYYKLRFDKYELPDYILVDDIEKFEIFNT